MKNIDSLKESVLFLDATLRHVDPDNPVLEDNDLKVFRILVHKLVGTSLPLKLDAAASSSSHMTDIERAAISSIAKVLRSGGLHKDGLTEIIAIIQSLFILSKGYDEYIKVCAADRYLDGFHLTGQERIVLIHIANGVTTKDIANRMRLSVKTVEHYRDRIITKLGLKKSPRNTSIALAHFAISRGFIKALDPTTEHFSLSTQ